MMRVALLMCLLAVGSLSAASVSSSSSSERERGVSAAFRAGYEYVFQYDSQIALGLVEPAALYYNSAAGAADEAARQSQKAATRFQSQVKIAVGTDGQAMMRIEKPRAGELNAPLPADYATRVQPLSIFQKSAQFGAEALRQLRLPVQFAYADGVIAAIKFDSTDSVFSKNIKRAILNLVQVDQRPMSGVEAPESELPTNENLYFAKAYTVGEKTMEGECETTYSVNSIGDLRRRADESDEAGSLSIGGFNVSKSIDFGRCKRIADVGFDGDETARIAISLDRCAKCLKMAGSQSDYESSPLSMKACVRECAQPRDFYVPPIDRMTTMRYVCAGRPTEGACALQRAELFSRYVYKSGALADLDAMTSEEEISVGVKAPSELSATATAQLEFISKSQFSGKFASINAETEGVESLIYDNSVSIDEKRYFMFGEAAFPDGKSPFAAIKNKVEQAVRALQVLVEAAAGPSGGVEATTVVVYMPRLVRAIRISSAYELTRIEKEAVALISKQQKAGNTVSRMRELYADTLAIAGTKNTIDALFSMIERQQINIGNAVHSISIIGTMTPSSAIIKKVLHLSNSEIALRNSSIRQALVLSAGALIGDACRAVVDSPKSSKYDSSESLKNHPNSEKESLKIAKLNEQKIGEIPACTADDAKYYAEILASEFKSAESVYKKILALKVIGNAALTRSMRTTLKPLIRDAKSAQNEEKMLLRVHAIDALRRMDASREIQRLLAPIYADVGERAPLRMIALTMMLMTRPDAALLNSIIYALPAERSREVKTFTIAALQSYAKQQTQNRPELSQHIRDLIIALNISDEDLAQASIAFVEMSSSSAPSKLSVVMTSMFGAEKAALLRMPAVASLGLKYVSDSMHRDAIGVFVTQIQMSQWTENVMKVVLEMIGDRSASVGRAQRGNAVSEDARKSADEKIRAIFQTLGIKKRDVSEGRDYDGLIKAAPFGAFVFRVGDVDKAVIPLDEQKLPALLRAFVKNERFVAGNVNVWNDVQFGARALAAVELRECSVVVPTAIGLPLKIHRSNPIFSSLYADAKLKINATTASVKFDAQPSVSAYRLAKLETQLPGQWAVGIETMRAAEANLPLKGRLSISAMDGLKLTLETPKTPKSRLVGLHSLTATYTRAFDTKTQSFLNAKLKAVRMPQLDIYEVEINEKFGEHSVGLPLSVTGHFHAPPPAVGQSAVSYLLALTKVGVATENHLHIVFEPTVDTPREFTFSASSSVFESISSAQVENAHGNTTALRDFYNLMDYVHLSSLDKTTGANSQKDQYENEKINNFLTDIGKAEMFKHTLRFGVESAGGRKQTKVEARLIAFCDASVKLCKLAGDMRRTPMLASESEWWSLKLRADVALPQTVGSVAELNALESSKQQKMLVKAITEWGPASASSAQKQYINFRIQGKCDTEKWISQLMVGLYPVAPSGSEVSENSADIQRIRRQMAFLNKFGFNANYKLYAPAQNFFRRALEILEVTNYWNSKSERIYSNSLVMDTEKCSPATTSASRCQFLASLEIDPISQRFANLTIRTMTKKLRIDSLTLPYRMRPFPIITAADASVHSMRQMIKRAVYNALERSRAKCVIGSTGGVKTFDGSEYNTPIPTCYTVLAKDCASQKFIVLMKSIDENNDEKKLKILTPSGIVECQPQQQSSFKKVICAFNGQPLIDSQSPIENIVIEYNNDDQTLVRIYDTKAGYGVKFSGLNAAVYLDAQYKNAQCGLCGHFDGNNAQSAEFLKADGQTATGSEELSDFVRSYTLHDPKECPKSMRDERIDKTKKAMSRTYDSKYSDDLNMSGYEWMKGDADETYTRKNNEAVGKKYLKKNEIDEERKFIAKSFNGVEPKNSAEFADNEQGQFRYEDPELRTHVVEYNHQICFSVQPIKECAEGSTPKTASDLAPSADFSFDFNAKVEVEFTCLPRSSPQARRMQQEALRGVTLAEELSQFNPNYSQKMALPVKCLKYIETY